MWMVGQELFRERRLEAEVAAEGREEENSGGGLWQDFVSLHEAFGFYSK